ncbi:MAG TPA: type VI secretion system baseplate subunit TssE [Acetobacteraceae bacterium]|nr:type VI secretion system baseplate subunit TssE [Acetobacteraceae bacterium]
MSGRAGTGARGTVARVQLPLLDRLIDDSPDQPRDPPISTADSMALLRQSVRRDLEALLNARRRWRSPPSVYKELSVSPIGFGIPDFTAGSFNDLRQREELRLEIEDTIRRFEPRFLSVRAVLVDAKDRLEATLRLRIEAVLHAEPAPEAVTFDTTIDPASDEVSVRANEAG